MQHAGERAPYAGACGSLPESPASSGLIGDVLPVTLITWGQQDVPSGRSAILVGLMPLMTLALAAVFVPSERIDRRHLAGFGLGFLFTPINNAVYGNIDPRLAQQAAGLINLARQLGGSFGIAILATYVTVHTQIHRVDLIANIYPGRQLVDERLQALTANLIAHGYGPDAARRGALALLDQQVMRQASMLSYNDAWMLLLISFLVVSPAIFLLRKPGATSAPVDTH